MNQAGLERARKLKEQWMSMDDECFQTTKFGDLKVGQMFIALPDPGDNHGHGGFLGKSFIFKKTAKKVIHPPGSKGIYGIPQGRAKRMLDGQNSDFPHSMDVLEVG